MLLGIVSDTHDRHRHLEAALALLEREGVDLVVHCGDVGGEAVVRLLGARPSALVWGNTDFPGPELVALVDALGIRTTDAPPLVLELDGRRIGVFHGHERAFRPVARSIRTREEPSGGFDWIFFGHTHQKGQWQVGDTRLANPGALHRATPKTVAILDTRANTLRFLDVPGI